MKTSKEYEKNKTRQYRLSIRVSKEKKALFMTMARINKMSMSNYVEMLVEKDAAKYSDQDKLKYMSDDVKETLENSTNDPESVKKRNEEKLKQDVDYFIKNMEAELDTPIDSLTSKEKTDFVAEKFDYIFEMLSKKAIYNICTELGIKKSTVFMKAARIKKRREILETLKAETGKTPEEFSHNKALEYIGKKTDYGKDRYTQIYYSLFNIQRAEFNEFCAKKKKDDMVDMALNEIGKIPKDFSSSEAYKYLAEKTNNGKDRFTPDYCELFGINTLDFIKYCKDKTE